MKITKRRVVLAFLIVLLLVSTLYHLGPGFFGWKPQREREALLVRRQISQPLQPVQGEGEEMAADQRGVALPPSPSAAPEGEPGKAVVETADEGEVSGVGTRDEDGVLEPASAPETPEEGLREARSKRLEATIRRLEQEVLARDKKIEDWKRRWEEKSRELDKIEDWKRRWEEKNRELARYERELLALRKEASQKERRLQEEKLRTREERARPGGKKARPSLPVKPVGAPLALPSLAECQGVPLSHRNIALFFSRELDLGTDLSYSQAVTALQGLGITPGTGWNEGDPSFPIWTEELEEILAEAEKAFSTGLVAGDYSELAGQLRDYCKRERVQLSQTPLCDGPMVTECEACEISHGEFAIYLSRVLGIGEELNYAQAFLTLGALHISPRRGWRYENPSALITQTEIEEVRCSVVEAYKRGCIETSPNIMVASLNDFCTWLKMDIQVVGRGTIAEAVAQTDYLGGVIPKGGTVKSASN